LAAATAFKAKMHGRELPKLHGKGQIFQMLRLVLIPASPVRAPLNKSEIFR
jgi:hypothetical protein